MTGQDWVIIGAGWLALALVIAGILWDQRCATRRADRHRDDLNNHARRLVHLEGTVAGQPTRTRAPMPVVTRSALVDADQTLRLARPPALSDIAGTIAHADRPLTRATIETELGRDVRSEIRAELLAGTLTMVRTHDAEPAYWPASPGGTLRMTRMPVLPGAA